MKTRMVEYQKIPEQVLELLPEIFRENNNIVFLVSQINQNIFILNTLKYNANDATQYQLLSKTINHLESIHDFLAIKIEDNHENDPHYEDLRALSLSNNLEKITFIIQEVQQDQKELYPFFDLESRIKRQLSNFQSMRIPSLRILQEDIDRISQSSQPQEEKLLNLQQALINYYYLVRKISWKIERWLFRKSRETKLGNSLESFINTEVLSQFNITLPHKITKHDRPIKLGSIKEEAKL